MRREQIADDVVVYLGNGLEIAPTLAGIDAVVSDPPYGMGWNADTTRFSGGAVSRGAGRADWADIVDDDKPFDPAPWLAYPHVVLWGANHFGQRLPVGKTLVWIKKDAHLFGTFLSDAEVGWAKGGHGVYCHPKTFTQATRSAEAGNGSPAHPTQKPLSLLQWCIEKFAAPATRILDPFMGSGTTGVAAMALGRGFVGIETQPAYFDAACRRLAAAKIADRAGQTCLLKPARARDTQEALAL